MKEFWKKFNTFIEKLSQWAGTVLLIGFSFFMFGLLIFSLYMAYIHSQREWLVICLGALSIVALWQCGKFFKELIGEIEENQK